MARTMEVESNSINIITAGTLIKGDITASGDFRLDGTLEGNIQLNGKLVVGDSGVVNGNILCVKDGRQEEPIVKALAAALTSKKVADFITEKYDGAVISIVDDPTDGFDADVDYDALAGQKISVAASPTPHAEVLAIAKEILAEKDITLEIKEFEDYVQPNLVVENGEFDANYFQHIPYLDDFNAENGTHIISVAAIHVEPMGVYSAKNTDLSAFGK